MQTRELWFTGPNCVELRIGELPQIKPGSVLVQALASGISQGTELLLFRGEGTEPFDSSLVDCGKSSYPCRYGYCWVGEVIDAASDVTNISPGERIFALAPHGDVHLLSPTQVRPISKAIPATRAVLAANIETAINCVWDSGVSIGDNVVVLGAGVVGLLIAWLSAKIGAEVVVIEPSEKRRAVACQLGATNSAGRKTSSHLGLRTLLSRPVEILQLWIPPLRMRGMRLGSLSFPTTACGDIP